MKTKNCLQAFLVLTLTSSVFVNAAQVNLDRLRSLENDVNKSEKYFTAKKSALIAGAVLANVAALGFGGYLYNQRGNELEISAKRAAKLSDELQAKIDILRKTQDNLGCKEIENADLSKQVELRLAEIEGLRGQLGQTGKNLNDTRKLLAERITEIKDLVGNNQDLEVMFAALQNEGQVERTNLEGKFKVLRGIEQLYDEEKRMNGVIIGNLSASADKNVILETRIKELQARLTEDGGADAEQEDEVPAKD